MKTFSPDGNRVAGWYWREEEERHDWAVFDLVTGATTLVRGATAGSNIVWENETTLRSVFWGPAGEREAPGGGGDNTLVRLLRIRLDPVDVEQVAEYVLETEAMVRVLPGARYALYPSSPVEEAEGLFALDIAPNLVLLDLLSDERIDLGAAYMESFGMPVSWSEEHKRLVLTHPAENGEGPTLAVHGPADGILAEKGFPRDDRIWFTSLSPDGNRVLYLRSRPIPLLGRMAVFGRYEVWNIRTGRTAPVETVGFLEIIFTSLTGFPHSSLPSWSPDGDLIAFSNLTWREGEMAYDVWFVEFPDLSGG
jgi:hypothetical protein